jgi:hypothetical protein
VRQGLLDLGATILHRAAHREPHRGLAEDEHALLAPQIALVRKGPQQVVGGGKRQTRLTCELLGRGAVDV